MLAAEVCASAVVMLDTPCSKVVWRILATHSIRQFPLHFPSRASPCAITFQLDSTTVFLSSGLSKTVKYWPHYLNILTTVWQIHKFRNMQVSYTSCGLQNYFHEPLFWLCYSVLRQVSKCNIKSMSCPILSASISLQLSMNLWQPCVTAFHAMM
jgi:hypothetical protein